MSAPALKRSALAARLIFVGGLLGKGLKLVTDVILARVLGPAGFGVVAVAMSLVNIVSEVGLLGLHHGLLRFGSVAESEGRPSAASRLLRITTLVAASLWAVVCVAVWFGRHELTALLFDDTVSPLLLPTFALAVPAAGLLTLFQCRARAARRFVQDTVLGNVARTGAPLLATLAFLAAGLGLWGVALGSVVGLSAAAIAGWLWVASSVRRSGPEAPAPSGRTESASDAAAVDLKRLLRVSLPLALASASILLLAELDKVMLALYRPEEEVGLYTAAFRVSRQVVIVLPALNAAASAAVAPLLAGGHRGELIALYRNFSRWSLVAGLSAASLFVLFGEDFLSLFGTRYVEGAGLLTILSMGYFVVAVAGTAGAVLQFSGNERTELFNGLLVTLMNVALNLALIPRYGAYGAAVATLASLALVGVRRVLQVRNVLGVLPWDRRVLGVFAVVAGALAGAAVLRHVLALAGVPPGLLALGAVAVMATTWLAVLRRFGVSEEEAALLRLPRSWVKAREARGVREPV